MKKKIWITIGVIILIAIFAGVNIWQSQASKNISVELTQLEEEVMTETIMVPGQLHLAAEQTVYLSPERGEVDEILVEEGDVVEKGAPLIRYKNKQLELEQQQIELQLRSNHLQIEQLQKQDRELEKKIKDSEVKEEKELLEEEQGQLDLQEDQAKIERERLQLQKQALEEQKSDLLVTADMAGTIVEVNEQAVHQTSQMEQEPIIRLGTLDEMIVTGVISEYDTMKVNEGQAAILSSEVLPDETWEGEVQFIADLPKKDEGFGMDGSPSSVQYALEVSVEAENIPLKPGFQMIVEIKTDERQANTLPITSVQQDGDVNYVYVVVDGVVERREVEVGSITNDKIEIKNGVTIDEQVVATPDDTIKDGMDVSVE